MPHVVSAAEIPVVSASQIKEKMAQAKPGDVLVMQNGVWTDADLAFEGQGTSTQPITLRAQTPGKVVLSGQSRLKVNGSNLIVSGLLFQNGYSSQDVIELHGTHCRLTESAIVNYNPPGGAEAPLGASSPRNKWIHLWGTHHRVDHCYFAGKTQEEPTFQVEVESQPNEHQIDHNHFGPRPPLGKNGGETMRIGYSGQMYRISHTTVEYNLYDRCDGELEVISSKSTENIYRYNTFRECAGQLVLRHGDRCLVEGNYFLGGGKKGSGGIRIIGSHNQIFNNYIADTDAASGGAIVLSYGRNYGPGEVTFNPQSVDEVIAFNTIVNNDGAGINLGSPNPAKGFDLLPKDIVVANNLFLNTQQPLTVGRAENVTWQGNLAQVSQISPDASSGVKATDVKVQLGPDGLYHPRAGSPAIGASQGTWPQVTTDMAGRSRPGRKDVGAEQLSNIVGRNRPLEKQDVGPSWMTER